MQKMLDFFGRHSMFHDYIQEFSGDDLREALINLFKVLDTPEDKRDPYLKENLASISLCKWWIVC